MENASKGLLIAAAVLVAVLIITVGIKIFSSTSETQKVGIETGIFVSSKTEDAVDLATLQISGSLPITEEKIIDYIGKAYEEYKNSGGTNSSTEYVKNYLNNLFNNNITDVTQNEDKITVTVNKNGEAKKYIYNTVNKTGQEYVNPIDYGKKTKETIQPGDDITIGAEKFKVLSRDNAQIKLIPYYNITITTDNPVQSESAGRNAIFI